MRGITINGVSIVGAGRGTALTISNGRVIIDGVDVSDQLPAQREIHIEIHGDVEVLDVDVAREVKVVGRVGKVRTMSGDVSCGDVEGRVRTVSGDVSCGAVSGSVSTVSGDIRHAKAK